MRRIAHLPIHGSSFHAPLEHAEQFADGLAAALTRRDGAERRSLPRQPLRTGVTTYDDIDDLGYEIVAPERSEIHHVIEPRYSHLTNGFVRALALVRWARQAVVGLSRSHRRWTSKSALESLQIGAVFALVAAIVWLVASAVGSTQPTFHAPLPAVIAALIAAGVGTLILVSAAYALFLAERIRAARSGIDAGDPFAAIDGALSAEPSALAMFFAIARLTVAGVFFSPMLLLALFFGGARTMNGAMQLLPLSAILETALAFVLTRQLIAVIKRAAAIAEDVYTVGDLARIPDVAQRRDVAMKAVARRVIDALQLVDADTREPYYDEVHLYGHSLGGIIGADIVAEIHRAVLAGILDAADAKRVRTLVTYGSAHEKIMRTFRMVHLGRNQNPYDRFRASAPPLFFAPGPERLYDARWFNVYYQFDMVAEHVSSPCCNNVRLRSPNLDPHTSYLSDPLFFDVVLAMIERAGLDAFEVHEPLPARIASFVSRPGLRVSPGFVRGSLGFSALFGGMFAAFDFAATHLQTGWLALGAFFPSMNALWYVMDDRQDPVVKRKAPER